MKREFCNPFFLNSYLQQIIDVTFINSLLHIFKTQYTIQNLFYGHKERSSQNASQNGKRGWWKQWDRFLILKLQGTWRKHRTCLLNRAFYFLLAHFVHASSWNFNRYRSNLQLFIHSWYNTRFYSNGLKRSMELSK